MSHDPEVIRLIGGNPGAPDIGTLGDGGGYG